MSNVLGLNWNSAEIPDQTGRIFIVTGGNGGIGYETARALARARATVIIAGRNAEKCLDAIARIKAEHERADLRFETLDLASLTSVSEFAGRITDRFAHIDVLVNNAGIMAPPKRETTADGFELQFGVNFLGHFALTARLLSVLRRAPVPLVVTLSSVVHKAGKIDLDDLQWEHRRYSPTGAYYDSKLATLMFAFELQRRSDAARWGLHSVAAHPGIARTDLMANGPGLNGVGGLLFSYVIKPFFSHSAAEGALPAIFAATALEAEDGGYYGPSRRFELVGPTAIAKVSDRARDLDVARQLWDRAQALTNVSFG
jgi:NAD(P)-dependent dehydrogenase (short-subunit alcohol dehydrogenase family)